MASPEIRTKRLKLTPIATDDAPAMFAYRSDAAVSLYQSFCPNSLLDVEDFILRLQGVAFDTPGTWYQLGIRLRDSGQLIGDVGVHFCSSEQVEIGFTVSPSYQRQGFATEAVTGVLDNLFGQLQKHRVHASVDPRNKPSSALLKRLGMRQEAHFVKSLRVNDEWVDDVVFGILESEWQKRQRAIS